VICLDTSYLVRGLIAATPEAASLIKWIKKGELLCASSIAWYEFACGPVDSEGLKLGRSLLAGGILPFEETQAAQAARLFNATGRSRRLRVDAIVAATSMVAGARLATGNKRDFLPFVEHGLKLI
jgi:predicted nucleic acid-binding protein